MRTVADPAALHALKQRLDQLLPGSPRRWGTLTPHEMLCHLADTSEGVLGLRARPAVPLRRRPVLKLVGLWLPVSWRGRSAGVWNNPRRDGSRPGDFAADRVRVVQGLEQIAAATGGLAAAHGMFGRMSVRDWQRHAYRHTDYHLRQFGL